MSEQPIYMSDNYLSGYNLRIRKTNGKVSGLWLEISDHHAKMEDTLGSLSNILSQLKLTDEVNVNIPKKAEPMPNDFRYYCMSCATSFPAFKEQPEKERFFCAKCDRWQMHQKKVRPRN